jgi:uncharacterized protein (DUF1015 family)
MTKLKPFQAVIYNHEKVKDISKVTCPPYDVISADKQQYYHDLNPYNFIHILLGKDMPGEDKYQRAASYLKDWLKDKILIKESKPAIYFYSQEYNIKGEKKTRFGFISLLGLGDKDSEVFKHEHTRLEPKEDRLKLMKQVNANLSPIFVVFQDKKRIIQRVYQNYVKSSEPFIQATDDEKTVHRLWRLDAPETIRQMQDSLTQEDIFIADGHHRFEVAGIYRDEMKKRLGDEFTGEESFNYVLSYFTNTDPRGLSILPIHRLLKLENEINLEAFKEQLKEYFDVEEVKDKTRFFFLMEKGGRTEHLLGMYKDKKFWFLRLKNIKTLDRLISDKAKEYRSLDVSILNAIVFKQILGLDAVGKDRLTYSNNSEELIREVDSDRLNLAFFLNPVKIQQIIAVALDGERMPPKSTYFYPKVLSGLVINKLEERNDFIR